MVFGTFDLFHPGHSSLLKQAQALGTVTVVVARSANVERIKGRKPMQSDEERAKAVKEAFPDADVILGDPNDFLVPIRERKPDVLLLGYDQALPPGLTESDLPCPVKRGEALRPDRYKSSLMAEESRKGVDWTSKK